MENKEIKWKIDKSLSIGTTCAIKLLQFVNIFNKFAHFFINPALLMQRFILSAIKCFQI